MRRKSNRNFPEMILFHHLITDRPKVLGLPTEAFLRQVQFLKKHYRIASLPEAIEMLERNEVPVPTVVLTFDDGYAENFLGLRAVIEAEDVPVTLFVCTQAVTERSEFDHDRARHEAGFPALSWQQVRYFDRHNASIGSHTRTHFDCGSTDRATLAEEIGGSHQDLRRELGHDVPFFSFPKGLKQNMSETAVELAGAHYPYIFSAIDGANHGPVAAPCCLYRCAQPQSLWELELLLQSMLEFDTPAQLDVPRGRQSTSAAVSSNRNLECAEA